MVSFVHTDGPKVIYVLYKVILQTLSGMIWCIEYYLVFIYMTPFLQSTMESIKGEAHPSLLPIYSESWQVESNRFPERINFSLSHPSLPYNTPLQFSLCKFVLDINKFSIAIVNGVWRLQNDHDLIRLFRVLCSTELKWTWCHALSHQYTWELWFASSCMRHLDYELWRLQHTKILAFRCEQLIFLYGKRRQWHVFSRNSAWFGCSTRCLRYMGRCRWRW